jgi:hypothetical protein
MEAANLLYNVGNHLPIDAVSYPRKLESSSILL